MIILFTTINIWNLCKNTWLLQNKNLKILGPRICAVRIHEDKIHEFMTMDSGASDTKSIPYAYSRSRTLVDDDLIENEENGDLPLNFHSSSRSSIVMSTVSNVEDEIFSTNKTDSEKFNEIKKELQQSSCINNNTLNMNSSSNNNNNNNQTEEILCEGDVASISDSVNENAIMKHQRVAQWILSNNSQISLSPGSDAQQKLDTPTFEQKSGVILEKLIDIDDDEDVTNEAMKKEANSSAPLEEEPNINDEKSIDLLQMEYNVKQFLLRGLTQQSSSVYHDLHFGDDGEDDDDDASHYIKHPQRTETNL